MSKQFIKTAGIFMLLIMLVSACQSSPTVAPVVAPTNPPNTEAPAQPTATVAPTAMPEHPQADANAARIQFTDTTMQVLPGDIEPNATKQFVFGASAGQTVTVNVTAEPSNGVVFSVWGADGKVLKPEMAEISTWEGAVPTTQDYYIAVRSVAAQAVNYTVTLRIPPLTPPEATRIQFEPNTTSWHTPGDLAPNAKIRFVLGAAGGQQMNVNLTTEPADSAFLYIWSADGTVFTLMAPTQTWSGTLPSTGDYYIEVRSVSAQTIIYQLVVEIPAGVSAPPHAPKIAKDQVIRFDAGPLNVTLNGGVISGERDRYTLSLVKGEIMDVLLSSTESNAAFTILGPDQNPLPGTEEGKDTFQWSIVAPVDGTYAILVGPTRGNATYALQVQVKKP